MALTPVNLAATNVLSTSVRSTWERWTPIQIFLAGEKGAWYDPSDLSTLFQDAAGTIPVTADGDPVGLMLDKSGNGYHASQSVSGSRLVYRTDGTVHWLEFNGVNAFLQTEDIDFSVTKKMTAVAGLFKPDEGGQGIICELTSISTNAGAFSLFEGAGGSRSFAWSASRPQSFIGTSGFIAPIAVVNTVQIDVSKTTIETQILPRINGETPPLTEIAGTPAFGNFANDKIYIGARGSGGSSSNMLLYSLIVRGSLSTVSEINSVESYSANISGITL